MNLSVRVTTFYYKPVANADVIAIRSNSTVAATVTDNRGCANLNLVDKCRVLLRVSAQGLASDERIVITNNHVELFVLGKPSMPFYYRKNVRVPFEPINNAVGLLMCKRSNTDSTRKSADQVSKYFNTNLLHSKGNFASSDIAIISVPDNVDDRSKLLERINTSSEVEKVGALVKLSDNNASFLTDCIIVCFADQVDNKTVVDIAARHELVNEGNFGDISNVYRLRFKGLPTYDVLDKINKLVTDSNVVWAEPDLVHTIEYDAVIPTDFLFQEQWDHFIINTPDAWQTLRNVDINRTFGSPDVIIAVVDSGVDVTHPDFSGTVSNGQPKIYRQFDFTNMLANMDSINVDHGTCCASASAANTNNAAVIAGVNEGTAGIAGNCQLIAIRSGGTESRYAEMYLWAAGFNANSSTDGFPAQINPGADVITNSFGVSVNMPISGLMSTTFDRLTDDGRGGRGTLLFFSAGNSNTDLDDTFDRPWGMYDRCFCVAASTLDNDGITEIKANYSSFGSTVDFCAPSSDNEGVHDPPTVYGAHAATILAAPTGTAIPGHSANQTTLTAVANASDTTVTVDTTAGIVVDQAILIGLPGAGGSEGRLITNVDTAANQIRLTPGLRDAHGIGTVVTTGPFSHRSNFGGTSYATPVCTGTGALALSANPQLQWNQVLDIFRDTAVKIDLNNTDLTGRWRDRNGRISSDSGYTGPLISEFFGFGRIDVLGVVRRAGWNIDLVTQSLVFNDIPQGETTVRGIRFNVQSLWSATFEITAGLAAPFSSPLGISTVSPGIPDFNIVREAIIWVAYTGTTSGSTASGSVTVTNSDTGRTWILPISANTVERPTSCVMLCLDKSGSMDLPSGIGTAKRIDVLRYSAEILIDVLHEGDGAGIVAFDQDPSDILVPPVGPLGPVTTFDVTRDKIRENITTFSPNLTGNTAVGDGIERAQQQLNPVTGYGNKAVIVFTDGQETAEKYISDIADFITDRIFAVALGRAENIAPAALTALTNGTGGYCVLTGDLNIDSRYKLAKYFLQVLAGVKNEDIVLDPEGLLRPGDIHTIHFMLTEADIVSDIILMIPIGEIVNFKLITPSGDVLNQQNIVSMPGSLYYKGFNVQYYRLSLPVPVGQGAHGGKWQAQLEISKQIPTYSQTVASNIRVAEPSSVHGLPYSLLVHTYSNLRMTANLTQSSFVPGANIELRAVLTEYNLPIRSGSNVVAYVTDPTRLVNTEKLAEVAQGVFTKSITCTIQGTWEVRFHADGMTLRNSPFTRETVRTASLWYGGDRNPPTSSSKDDTSKTICKVLNCLLSKEVIREDLRKKLYDTGFNIDSFYQCVKSNLCSSLGNNAITDHSRAADLQKAVTESTTTL